jgi:hypothetical protein
MAIAIRNDRPTGRFFRYRVNGAPKSVWIDGYSEIVVKELNDTSTMLDKISKAKAERLEKTSNFKTLNHSIRQQRLKIFKDVSKTDRWRPKILKLETGFNAFIFNREGKGFLFASPPNQELSIGVDIRGAQLNVLSSYYDGVYRHGQFNYTINGGEIIGISEIGEGITALTFNCFNVTHTATTQAYQAYTSGSTNVYDNGAQWFSTTGGTGSFWTGATGGFHYSGSSVYIINVSGSSVSSSGIYTNAPTSPIFSAYTYYEDDGTAEYARFTRDEDSPFGVNTNIYNNNTLTTQWNVTGTYKYDVPDTTTNKKVTLSDGEIVSVENYAPAVKTLNLSATTATTRVVYFQNTESVDQVGVILFSDSNLTSRNIITGVLIDFSQTPNRYIDISSGEVIASGDISWPGGAGVTYTSWSIRDSGANILTIYTQQGDALTKVGVTVYANSDGTGNVTQGIYTYNDKGTNKNVTVGKFSVVTKVAKSGK